MPRQSSYNQETVDKVCEKLAEGHSLRSICRSDDSMPNMSTIFRWLDENAEFASKYARARQVQADVLFDELVDIADDGSNDWMTRNGYRVEDSEVTKRSQLRIETRKWVASKLLPKKYGEKYLEEAAASADLASDAPVIAPDEPVPGKPIL